MVKRQDFSDVRTILDLMNSVFNEISEYNETYWSKFMFGFWMSIGAQAVLFLFGVIFMSMPLIQRFILTYNVAVLGSGFLFVIFTASSVNIEGG